MSNRSEITLASVVMKSENFVESKVDGEAILMHIEDGKFAALKSTGLRIWDLLETPQRVEDICNSLLAEFEVSEEVCQAQTLGFLQGLLDRTLITEKGA